MGRCAGQNGGEAGAHTFSGKNAGVKAFFSQKNDRAKIYFIIDAFLLCCSFHHVICLDIVKNDGARTISFIKTQVARTFSRLKISNAQHMLK